jgi:hypothetical protein
LGKQVLSLTNNGSVTLHAGEILTVHITSPTTNADTTGSSTTTAPARLGAAGNYAVLYTGTGGHNLSITNVTVHGNVGVGGTGHVQFSGPGAVGGRLDFAAANTGQYSNSNGSNIGPTSANYNVSAVTTALSTVTTLSSSLSGLGNSLAIGGNQTINESAGLLTTVNGVTYRIFNVTSYSENDGKLVTINNDVSGPVVPVVFNFGFNSNVNLGGDVALTASTGDTALTDDQVLWNFTTSGKGVSLNNNASSYPNFAFHGIILAINDPISVVNANLSGRVFGGNCSDMQIVSGDTILAPLLNTATVAAGNVSPDSDDTATATVSIVNNAPISRGMSATIGFWKNRGQSVITSISGTALGNWLAANWPNLFGGFANQNSTYVANAFKNGSSNTYLQAFAIALDIYFDTTSLGGATIVVNGLAAKYGFKVSDNGGGYATWNIGGDGGAFGVSNNSNLPLNQILGAANQNYNPQTSQFYGGDPTLTDELNTTLNGINEHADIMEVATNSSTAPDSDGPELLGSIGDLRTGNQLVYVDNSQGNVTLADQARIDNAIGSLDKSLGKYGVNLVVTTKEQAANITITLADTTELGGQAQGVLGLYSFGGSITLVDTWNWYTGANPSGIGSGQYDFQTVVTHELGHALGFGHSTDPNSAMFESLPTGVTRRGLTTADLSVISQVTGIVGSSSPAIKDTGKATATPAGAAKSKAEPRLAQASTAGKQFQTQSPVRELLVSAYETTSFPSSQLVTASFERYSAPAEVVTPTLQARQANDLYFGGSSDSETTLLSDEAVDELLNFWGGVNQLRKEQPDSANPQQTLSGEAASEGSAPSMSNQPGNARTNAELKTDRVAAMVDLLAIESESTGVASDSFLLGAGLVALAAYDLSQVFHGKGEEAENKRPPAIRPGRSI